MRRTSRLIDTKYLFEELFPKGSFLENESGTFALDRLRVCGKDRYYNGLH